MKYQRQSLETMADLKSRSRECLPHLSFPAYKSRRVFEPSAALPRRHWNCRRSGSYRSRSDLPDGSWQYERVPGHVWARKPLQHAKTHSRMGFRKSLLLGLTPAADKKHRLTWSTRLETKWSRYRRALKGHTGGNRISVQATQGCDAPWGEVH